MGAYGVFQDLEINVAQTVGYVGDLFFPEWLSRRTFSIFTSLFVLGLFQAPFRLLYVW